MNFTEFGLHPDLLDGVDAMNYKTATPIQEKAIPIILEGKDLIGIAQTGTGKTAAFILPVLNEIIESGEANFIQTLVIVPTRELAVQIDQVIEAYSYFTGVSSIAIYGGGDGKEFAQEKNALVSGVDIVIATPGRLISHLNMGYVNFSKLRFLVLDEADRMMDMGFQPDLMRIIGKIPQKRQTLLFSATMPESVMKLARQLTHNAESVSIALSKPAEGVTQRAYVVYEEQKLQLVTELLKDRKGQRIVVFCSSKASVSSLYSKLHRKNLSVGQMSSDVEQDQREETMLAFRNSKIDIIVATDVISRGIDVDGIDLVVNYDVPRDPEDYVHRVGRTARAERKGEAITLVSPGDQLRFRRIEKLIDKDIEKLGPPQNLGPGPEYAPNARRGKTFGPPHRQANAQGKGGNNQHSNRSNSGGGGGGPHKKKSGSGSSRWNNKPKPSGERTEPRRDV
ncbi:DEAD/DEAH box helicase [Haliscomenobacter hydrossis]|uniref:DEAD/DEAH box helicase domain protein n=1 Tax=Haliscomenobacter hydrossis (strain ATCC 27775 / DSM 1100 / LMG 10767 / O) TaxID=760192 RepID=F4KTT6_HALH1|nr:DEAD/DEAH box helicase [Haliscomenobacter hydrossis]AEE48080.1 DEAD/DEAH box helicase domain protein [Haliscomenobacter hydrossis DSM 1100]